MDRKEFLKRSAFISAGLSLGLVACKQKKGTPLFASSDHGAIRIAVIGIGSRGSDIVKILQNIPVYKLVACSEVLPFRIQKAQELVGPSVKVYEDYRKMLAENKLDAVAISSPLHLHHEMVMAAMDLGVHVMCEKALTHTVEEAIAIKQRANSYKPLIQVSYQYQLNPTFNAIKEMIASGHCGRITRVEGMWHRNTNWRREVPSPAFERQVNWRMYREYSGGLMAELGSHQLNMIDNILGAHPTKVVGSGGIDYWKDGRETFDNVDVIYDYPGGVKATFSAILANKYDGFCMKFLGDKATIITHSMNNAIIHLEEKNDAWNEHTDGVSGASIKLIDDSGGRKLEPKKSEEEHPYGDNNYMYTTWLLYNNFALAILGKEDLKLGIEEGYRSAISVHMANDALHNDRTVRWDASFDV